jgi:hypothetical protein
MINTKTKKTKVDLVLSLRNLRQDLETASNGESLIDAQGSVGLILFDLVSCLGLSFWEESQILGSALLDELDKPLQITLIKRID